MSLAAEMSASLTSQYDQLRSTLLAYLRRMLGDRAAAEDLLQDVIVKALTAAREERELPANLAAWLHTVARNAAIDYLRARRPTANITDDLPQFDAEPVQEELLQCLRPMAERLPATYRSTVIAAEFAETPLAAIAATEGVSLSAIKSRVSRGRSLLREELAKCCAVALAADSKRIEYDERKFRGCGDGSYGGPRGSSCSPC
jgi:RNA polymerase sigma-70 factor (ECF subfamily)